MDTFPVLEHSLMQCGFLFACYSITIHIPDTHPSLHRELCPFTHNPPTSLHWSSWVASIAHYGSVNPLISSVTIFLCACPAAIDAGHTSTCGFTPPLSTVLACRRLHLFLAVFSGHARSVHRDVQHFGTFSFMKALNSPVPVRLCTSTSSTSDA